MIASDTTYVNTFNFLKTRLNVPPNTNPIIMKIEMKEMYNGEPDLKLGYFV